MRRRLAALVVLMAIVLIAFVVIQCGWPIGGSPGTACVPQSTGLVAWWPADGTAEDVVGPHDGTFEGTASYGAGKVGQAFSLDGASFVRVPSHPALNPTGSFTFELWVMPGTGYASLIERWGDEGDLGNRRVYSLEVHGGGGLSFALSDEARQGDSNFHQFLTGVGAAPAGAWTHVAFVYDQSTGTRSVYASGNLVGERTDPPITLMNAEVDLTFGALGRSSTNMVFHLTGGLDEIKLFNRALNAAEIAATWRAGASGTCRPR